MNIAIPFPVDGESYLNYEPYATYRIYLPFVGMQNISSQYLRYGNTLTIRYIVDWITGQIGYKLYVGNSLIATFEGECATNIQLANVSTDVKSYMQNINKAEGSALSTGFSAGGQALNGNILGATGTILSNMQSIENTFIDALYNSAPQVTTKGSNGSFMDFEFETDIILFCDNLNVVSVDSDFFGGLYCALSPMGDLFGGYVKTRYASAILHNAYRPEIEAVNSFLNGGIYLE